MTMQGMHGSLCVAAMYALHEYHSTTSTSTASDGGDCVTIVVSEPINKPYTDHPIITDK